MGLKATSVTYVVQKDQKFANSGEGVRDRRKEVPDADALGGYVRQAGREHWEDR
ncbi:hypothetical protein GCM10027269_05220 [Kribbella endophytica]